MKILIADEDPQILRALRITLTAKGYEIITATNGAEAISAAIDHKPDIYLLDLGMPELDGIDVIHGIRGWSESPILVVSGRTGAADKVDALDAGADDYVTKPFSVEELLARVNALLRRAAGWSKPTLECGPVMLDLAAQTVSVNGGNVDLTSYEYKVLEYLMMHAGELVSKADLTEHIYQQDFDRDSNVLEVFIGRLRRKLDPDGTLKPIETVRGRGYRFAIPRNGEA